jgi:NAD(P)-dependent dehydrogenase (short-subunit alcohol dehydrogenase family)
MSDVIVVIGAGSIGQAIARRVSAGKHVVLADLNEHNADSAAQVLRDAGFTVTTTTVDIASRPSIHALVETATALGDITGVIHAAGVSPSQAPPARILAATSTAPPPSSKSSATSSPPAAQGSSSPHSPGTDLMPSPPNRTPRWPRPPSRTCSTCRCSSPMQ